jgi:hypothetical protein
METCGIIRYFCRSMKAFKKKIFGLGILFILVVKYPPMPEFALFAKQQIVEVRCFSLKQIALQFFMN